MLDEAAKQNEAMRAAFAELRKAINPNNGNGSDKYGKRPKCFLKKEWYLFCEKMDATPNSDDDPFEVKKQPLTYRTFSEEISALQSADQASGNLGKSVLKVETVQHLSTVFMWTSNLLLRHASSDSLPTPGVFSLSVKTYQNSVDRRVLCDSFIHTWVGSFRSIKQETHHTAF